MKLTTNIDKFGTAGLFLTAIFSPCCFPLFAFAASALGLGSFELFGGWTMWIFQAMVLISVGGLYISYRRHRCMYPLIVAIPSGILIFTLIILTTANTGRIFFTLVCSDF